MEIIEKNREAFVVRLTVDDLLLLNNALNEVLNGLDIEEFSTRLGASREEAKTLLAQVHALLH